MSIASNVDDDECQAQAEKIYSFEVHKANEMTHEVALPTSTAWEQMRFKFELNALHYPSAPAPYILIEGTKYFIMREDYADNEGRLSASISLSCNGDEI